MKNFLRGLRIGYYPGSLDFSAPSDRRRFVRYANKRGIDFEFADFNKKYDIVILNQRADLSVWSCYRFGKTKIIYDAIDSYIFSDKSDWKSSLRGTSKFLTRQSCYWQPNYKKAVELMCCRADAVICSTKEQQQAIKPFCLNTHLILDMHDGDIGVVKKSYETGDTVHIVWEGLASSGIPMALMKDALACIFARRKVALHLITDPIYYRYHNKFLRCNTVDEVVRYFGALSSNVFVHQWNSFVLSQLAVAADLAIIPINLDNLFSAGKPENKLLLFWRMALPTVVSATSAYSHAMMLAGLDLLACADISSWHHALDKLVNDIEYRTAVGRTGLRVAQTYYSEEQMMARWDCVFSSILS